MQKLHAAAVSGTLAGWGTNLPGCLVVVAFILGKHMFHQGWVNTESGQCLHQEVSYQAGQYSPHHLDAQLHGPGCLPGSGSRTLHELAESMHRYHIYYVLFNFTNVTLLVQCFKQTDLLRADCPAFQLRWTSARHPFSFNFGLIRPWYAGQINGSTLVEILQFWFCLCAKIPEVLNHENDNNFSL